MPLRRDVGSRVRQKRAFRMWGEAVLGAELVAAPEGEGPADGIHHHRATRVRAVMDGERRRPPAECGPPQQPTRPWHGIQEWGVVSAYRPFRGDQEHLSHSPGRGFDDTRGTPPSLSHDFATSYL